MKTRQELKQEAKKLYHGKWNKAVALNIFQSGPKIVRGLLLAQVVYFAWLMSITPGEFGEETIVMVFVEIALLVWAFFPGIIVSTILLILKISAKFSTLTWYQTKQLPARIKSDWVCVLTKKYLLGTIVVELLKFLLEFCWSLLLIIPGIVKQYSYCLADYIFKDFADQGQTADLKYIDCISQSKQMMQGHKAEFFVLQLSFLGWDLLEGLTLGIASLWIVPYKNATYAAYYQALKADAMTA